ncbi:hypothetical protein BRADO3939 [Bradyrhizobium sp. ORS 278]|nr:hypothetical protein BRADO3939 [Bradyrhizobium sp. ORS 278]
MRRVRDATWRIMRLLFDNHIHAEISATGFRRRQSHDTNHSNDTGDLVANRPQTLTPRHKLADVAANWLYTSSCFCNRAGLSKRTVLTTTGPAALDVAKCFHARIKPNITRIILAVSS